MSIHEHSRFAVFNRSQHPYRHTLNEFAYGNPIVPGVADVQGAMDYLFSVIYPKSIGVFADMAALLAAVPVPSPNDYAFLTDDGDGKSAGYVYQTIDGIPAWNKRYDVDWSMESILAETMNRTQYMYVHKFGMTDRDAVGVDLAGNAAGQHIYGGDATGQHLTLHANSADTLGAITGYIQTEASIRPLQDATFDLGTNALRFRDLQASRNLIVSTLTLGTGSIVDSSGAIDFGANDLSTTGNLDATQGTFGGTLVCSTGNITDSTGTIDFGATNLTTTGTIEGGTLRSGTNLYLNASGTNDPILDWSTVGATTGLVIRANGSNLGNISNIGNMLLTSYYTQGASRFWDGGLTGYDQTTNLAFNDANSSILFFNSNAAKNLAHGLIRIDINKATNSGLVVRGAAAQSADIQQWQDSTTAVLASIDAAGTFHGSVQSGNILLSGNTIATTNANGDLILAPNGSGVVQITSDLIPSASNANDLGASGSLWRTLYLGTALSNGTNQITIGEALALRNNLFRDAGRSQSAQNGDALFYDSTSGTWLASAPDTEIDHSTLSGLLTGDAGHTQFVMLAGRVGGQTVQGGTAASEDLILESTAHATKGQIIFRDPFVPAVDNTTDLGAPAKSIADVYSKGEFIGLRAENLTAATLPSAGASSTGRLVYETDAQKLMVDNGGAWVQVGASKYLTDTSWDGVATTKTVTLPAGSISDARTAIWQFCDNANGYERIYLSIQTISATQVVITSDLPLPAGSYRLIGLE